MSAIALSCILLALAAAVLLWLYTAQRRELRDVSQLSQQLQRIAIGGSLAGRVDSGSSKPELSALVTAINHLLTRAAAEHDTEVVVLAGGVFANRRLLAATEAGLAAAGLRVLTPERLPAGDGGISYGQVSVAAAAIGAAPC